MFDAVGAHRDPEARGRTLVATAAVLLGITSVWCGVTVIAFELANPTIHAVPLDDTEVLIEVLDVQLEAPPQPPPLVVPAPAAPKTPSSDDAAPASPVATAPAVEPPPSDVPSDDLSENDAAPGTSEPTGLPVGPPGCPTCPPTGTGTGERKGDGEGGGGSFSDIPPGKLRKFSQPIYPAHLQGLPDIVCRTTITIDVTGRPERVDFDDCPEAFREAARMAVLKWRYQPATRGGVPVPSEDHKVFRFVPPPR